MYSRLLRQIHHSVVNSFSQGSKNDEQTKKTNKKEKNASNISSDSSSGNTTLLNWLKRKRDNTSTTSSNDEDRENSKKSRTSESTITIEPIASPSAEVTNRDQDIEDLAPQNEDSFDGDSDDRSYPTDGLSPYERERLENIRKNQAVLESLGIAHYVAELHDHTPLKPKKKPKKKVSPPITPRRQYSLRGRNSDTKLTEEVEVEVEVMKQEQAEEEDSFDDSSVLKYICTDKQDSTEMSHSKNENSTLVGYAAESDSAFNDPSLTRIYGMDFSSSGDLLAAAGHGGVVAVFGVGKKGSEPLFSFKAHRGWISGAQFVSQPQHNEEASVLLMTASNDATMSIWDVAKQGGNGSIPSIVHDLQYLENSGKAKKIAHTNTLHSSGIFSFDYLDGHVLTGSKDGTCAYSAINGDQISKVKAFEGYHSGVVKCVNFRRADGSNKVFASCGNDTDIHVMDIRQANAEVCLISEKHNLALNSVTWAPHDEYMLMSAGFETKIQLFDIRNPSVVLHTLQRHVNPKLTRCKGIYHPQFCANGNAIITSGEQSQQLTLYCSKTGNTISKGLIGFDVSSLTINNREGTRLAVAHNKGAISLFAAQWSK